MNTSVPAQNEISDFAIYVDRIIERANTNNNGEVDLNPLLDNSVEDVTNKIIVDMVKTDFSKFSKVRSSLKQVLMETKTNEKPTKPKKSKKNNQELVGV